MEKSVSPDRDPAVSVIIPTFNHAHFLAFAINSVLDQNFHDFEIIVVDDGSTDHPEYIVEHYEDPRLRMIWQENKGLAAARNSGLAEARGKYVAFLDADDLFLPNNLETQVEWLSNHPDYGFVAGGFNYVDENLMYLGKNEPWLFSPEMGLLNWLNGCLVVIHSVLVLREWLERVGSFDTNFRRVEDWDLYLRLAYAGCKMGWNHEIICDYRLTSGQMTRNVAEQNKISQKVLEKFFAQSNLPDDLLKLKPIFLGQLFISSAAREYSVGHLPEAIGYLRNAIQLDHELVVSKIDLLIKRLVSYSDQPLIGDPIDYVRRIFDNLPDEAEILKSSEHSVMGEIGLKTFFEAYTRQNWPQVQRAWLVVVKNAPQRLINRGIWVILFKSFLG